MKPHTPGMKAHTGAGDNYGHALQPDVHKSGCGVHSAGPSGRYGAYAHVRRQVEIRAHGGTHHHRFVAHPDMKPREMQNTPRTKVRGVF